MILLLALPLAFLLGSILTILWFGNAVDEASRIGEERGRNIERHRIYGCASEWE